MTRNCFLCCMRLSRKTKMRCWRWDMKLRKNFRKIKEMLKCLYKQKQISDSLQLSDSELSN